MQLHLPRRSIALFLCLLPLCIASCGGGDDDEQGTGNPGTDTTAPVTLASPPGGTYTESQSVTLTSTEPATIYYTIDGSIPAVGSANTLNGPSPVSGIAVNASPTSVKYFAVDAAGNEEVVRTQTYVIDAVIPVVNTVGPALDAFGLLTTQRITWQSSEDGAFRVQLGGNGSPGTGVQLQTGTVTANSQRLFDISGWQLGFVTPQPLWFVVSDAAGNDGRTSVELAVKNLESLPLVPETRGIAITPDGSALLASFYNANGIAVYDIDPASPTFHTPIAGVSVGLHPTGLAITPDGTRAYVGHDTGVDVIDITGLVALPIIVPGVDPIADVVITPDGSRAYFARSGILYVLDTDPSSPSFHVVQPAVPNVPLLRSANLAATPDGNYLVVAWFGVSAYSVAVIDIAPESPTYHSVIQTPVPLGLGNPVAPAASHDSNFAFVGNAQSNLARINFNAAPIAIDLASASISPDAALVASGDEHLLVLDQGASALTIVDPVSLQVLGSVPWLTLGRVSAITPDGRFAYVLRNAGLSTQQLVAVPLE